MAKRLRWIPIPYTKKERIILSNILPVGLYGVEAAWVNKPALRALRAAIADALGPRSARTSNDIVFNNTLCSQDLDPETYIVVQRVMNIRRAIAKHPSKHPKIIDIINNYQDPYYRHFNITNPGGPVGLLMNDLSNIGASLTADLQILRPHEPPIDIQNLPWQHLKKAITAMMARTRIKRASQDRTHLDNVCETKASDLQV